MWSIRSSTNIWLIRGNPSNTAASLSATEKSTEGFDRLTQLKERVDARDNDLPANEEWCACWEGRGNAVEQRVCCQHLARLSEERLQGCAASAEDDDNVGYQKCVVATKYGVVQLADGDEMLGAVRQLDEQGGYEKEEHGKQDGGNER